jgi:hypothetical protein
LHSRVAATTITDEHAQAWTLTGLAPHLPADLIAANQTATLRPRSATAPVPLVQASSISGWTSWSATTPTWSTTPAGRQWQPQPSRCRSSTFPKQIVTLADRIAHRTGVGLNTVATASSTPLNKPLPAPTRTVRPTPPTDPNRYGLGLA